MSNDDYFSPVEIRKRIHRQSRRQFTRTLNITFTMMVSVLMAFILVPARSRHPFMSNADRTAALNQLLLAAAIFLVLWIMLLVHRIWLNGQMKIDQEIDASMRVQRYGDEDDYRYRLSDDGELFYDTDEIEYDVKPKRKWKAKRN